MAVLRIEPVDAIIHIDSPSTATTAQELHDFVEDFMASPEGMGYPDIITPEGKIEDPTQPGVYSQIILVLSALYQIQFWSGSGYTTISGGKIVGGVADEVILATGGAGDVTVLISPVDGVTVASPGQAADIAAAVWARTLAASLTAEELTRILAAALAGKVSGADGPTVRFRNLEDTADAITSSVDAVGNRTAVTLNPA
ncbi:MAG TPA: hypothetical protein VFH61_18820 [Thermoleophilia bacterium]|nr:hypothetical protein [Thermoleophilia bacterium]